jgi:outer membrane protein assembly factor BamC
MRHVLTLLALAMFASGCSFTTGKKIDYQSSAQKSLPSLEVPPDLVLPAKDSRYAVPAVGGAATYSAYDRSRGAQAQAGSQTLLPKAEKISLERAGSQRWLVVAMPAAQVWPVLKDFWQELGFVIDMESPQTGVMETDWAENRAKIPQEGIRKWIGKALDFAYSTAERDKFRSRVETAADGRTEIYISHRGMVEVFEGTQSGGDQGQGRTLWQPRPPDPELEADMLRRLVVRLGVEEAQAKSLLADQAVAAQAALIKGGESGPGVTLPDAFDRAWRRVGLALDRVGFVVEDRDRAAGTYFVRYADPEMKPAKGLLDKLVFWNDAEKKPKPLKYQVKVREQGNASLISVHLADGAVANNETGVRIATLLYEQLK